MIAYRAEKPEDLPAEVIATSRLVEVTQRSPMHTLCVAMFALSGIGLIYAAMTEDGRMIVTMAGIGQVMFWGIAALLARQRTYIWQR